MSANGRDNSAIILASAEPSQAATLVRTSDSSLDNQ